MASLIPGYEYDIFISYRQKDNKGSRWVSEFVEALKTELESTFKEDISIYFDENPHDGLLETHDVDASLKEKLKCLIFIPVISRTYCDPNSFAWEHEFKAFVEQAARDQFGLKIKLPSGNVSIRVLPIRIYDLDPEDIKLCETILGGVLRSMDFIYKSPGVNRPLQANEDHPKDNLNKTYYRDQINKVANAIDEIIRSLKYTSSEPGEKFFKVQTNEDKSASRIKDRFKGVLFGKNRKKLFIILLALIICCSAVYIIYRSIYLTDSEKTLAFIPLRTSQNDTLLNSEGDYLIEAVNDKLNLIKSISVIPSISTHQYRNTEKSLDMIRKELKINYCIDGNMRWYGKEIQIWIELSTATDNKILWSNKYAWDKNQVAHYTREIVQVIAHYLDVKLSPEQEKQILTEPSTYPEANLNYISANIILKDAWFYINYGDRLLDSTSYSYAIEKYGKVIKEDSLFALAYAKRAIATSWGLHVRQLDSSYIEKCKKDIDKALSIDKDLVETQIALGFYYYYCDPDFDKALFYFNKAAEMDPGNYQPLYYLALVYRRMGKWKESQDLIYRVIRFNPKEALFLTNIGLSYTFLHKYDSALIYHQKAIDLVPGWPDGYKNKIETIILKNGKISLARTILDDAIRKTGETMIKYRILLNIYEKKYADALNEAKKSKLADYDIQAKKYLYLAKISTALNNVSDADKYYDSALVSLNLDLKTDPLNHVIHSLTGIAYAGLGNKIKAIMEGEKAITLIKNNKMDESDMKINLAQIYTMVGDYDNALAIIAYLLNNQSCFSERILQLDPVWKPLMDQPEFKTKIKKYS